MNIKRRPLELHNLIVRKVDDLGIGLSELSDFRLNLMSKGVFVVGPTLIKCDFSGKPIEVAVPVSSAVENIDNKDFSYQENLVFEDGIYLRDGNDDYEEKNVTILMNQIAKDLELEMEDYVYCIIINVYGEKMIDIYAPVK